ncbi:hypothetical protein MKK64_18460 [Methylobacterium sp. E-025]|uniref:hypothetical protein n=1 Tax=unclassified Methylobacterium TaxID=2615210 RepID=UPI0011CB8A24|nr:MULTISPECIES: hypothetical protein [unclassified Methylobacterium]MCJ2005714.1 hypothetical protein [Methylobacterium sp. J-092]MCJ2038051.1 hypothetical protein [Methylobacterium sp. J-059]MCJ2074656.1 hypothetical protein [Methylobacterium sp. E-016]MCJ2113165.1 hypothetical protein [Methylobacterium sp. E-025]TXN73098.1 hypothetical protein FV230_02425 [Methylobacterium sp. WL6]
MRHLLIAATLAVSAFAIAGPAQAQGLVGGVQRGSAEGNRVGGPVGGVVGGAVGGAVGTVNGALGIDPGRRAYRTDLRSRRAVRHHRRHRR